MIAIHCRGIALVVNNDNAQGLEKAVEQFIESSNEGFVTIVDTDEFKDTTSSHE